MNKSQIRRRNRSDKSYAISRANLEFRKIFYRLCKDIEDGASYVKSLHKIETIK